MLGLLWWGLQTLLLPSLRHSSLLGVCVCACVCVRACVCVCMYMHVCLCMCAHVRTKGPQLLQLVVCSMYYVHRCVVSVPPALPAHTPGPSSMQPPLTVQQPHAGVPPWPVHPATGRNSLSAHKVSVRGLSIGVQVRRRTYLSMFVRTCIITMCTLWD